LVMVNSYLSSLVYQAFVYGFFSIHQYLKSANQGYVDAQFNMGVMYHTGVAGITDLEKAAKWYIEAAGQGHADARHNLDLITL
ncbi:tetratricopeptide repeat protein, partial [Psychrobacter sanguinis]